MIKWLFVVVMLQLSAVSADAQKLYAIAVGDTDNNAIGMSIGRDLESFNTFVEELGDGLGNDSETFLLTGEHITKGYFEEVINRLSLNADDIVIFAFFGNGGRSANNTSAFPQIMMTSSNDMTAPDIYAESFIPLENIKTTLQNKGAGLVVVLGSCGNDINRAITPKKLISENRQTKNGKSNKDATDALHKLFGAKGYVIMSASSKGEYAWCNNTGSFFAQTFFRDLSDYIKNASKEASWEDFLSKVKNDVIEITKGGLGTNGTSTLQTPVYETNIQ